MNIETSHNTAEVGNDNQEFDSGYEIWDVSPEVWNEVLSDVELPQGYGVIGGAARSIAFKLLRGDEPPFVRDVDLVCTEDADMSYASILAEKYSPDDAAHNHGVQQLGDMDQYFGSRDFTMNQLLVVDGKLIMTSEAARDFKDGVIQLTPYEHREDWFPSDRMTLKALLLESALTAEGHEVKIADQDREVFDDRSIGDAFSLALTLQKSLEYGQDVAEEYWRKLADRGMLNEFDGELVRAAQSHDWDALASEIDQYLSWGFNYRGSAKASFVNDGSLSEFIWSQADYQDDIEDWRDRLDAYSGKGSEYLGAEYGGN